MTSQKQECNLLHWRQTTVLLCDQSCVWPEVFLVVWQE